MADEKKPDPKAPPAPSGGKDPFEEIVFVLIILFVVAYLVNAVIRAVSTGGNLSYPNFFERVLSLIGSIWNYIKFISVTITLCAIAGVVYLYQKIIILSDANKKLIYPVASASEISPLNPKWEKILSHIESINENDWRLAILEADIMLGEILENLGLHGETMGEKLKAVEPSDFLTLDSAWEAHKIRNQIAHEGSAFVLNSREARRVIELYRTVFEEFEII